MADNGQLTMIERSNEAHALIFSLEMRELHVETSLRM